MESTLCFDCANAYSGKCKKFSIGYNGKPLDFWIEYEETEIRFERGRKVKSFRIDKCELYEPDKIREKYKR